MSTVRIQIRRGTASEWSNINPVLAAGEMGLESDTNFIKFGDGTSNWSDLSYANEPLQNIQNALADYVQIADIGTAGGVVGLNSSKNAIIPGSSVIIEGSTNDDYETTLTVVDPTADRTITFPDANGTVQLRVDNVSDTEIGYLNGVTSNIQTQLDDKVSFNQPEILSNKTFNTSIKLEKNSTVEAELAVQSDSSVKLAVSNNPLEISGHGKVTISSLDDIELIAGTNKKVKYGSGLGVDNEVSNRQYVTDQIALLKVDTELSGTTNVNDLVVDGNLTVNGTNTILNTNNLYIENNEIILEANAQGAPVLDAFLTVNRGDALDVKLKWNKTTETWQLTNDGTTFDNISVHGDITSAVLAHSIDTTDVHGISDTAQLATKTYADNAASTVNSNLTSHANDTTNIHGIEDTSLLVTQSGLGSAISTHNSATVDVHGISNTADLAYLSDVSSAISTHSSDTTNVHGINDTSALATKTYADNAGTEAASSAVFTHNQHSTNVHGIADTSLLATKTYADTAASSYTDTALSAHNSSTTNVHGISNTADLATKLYVDNAVDTHSSDTTSVHGISDTSKIVFTTDTGTVTSTMIANGTIVNADINSAAAITYSKLNLSGSITDSDLAGSISQSKINNLSSDLGLKAPLLSPTFTGTVVLPSSTSIGNVSSTEIGYVDGVTSSIQTQLDSKLATSTASSTYAPIASPTFTGTVSGITKSMVGLGNVDNTTDANKPISTATQTALDLKAPIASPTFTGTVSGITKSMVGLGSVDNTSDASKPISTATQTALDGKASLSGATFTGAVNGTSLTLSGNLTVNGVTSTVESRTLKVEDNLIYLNDPISATITNASGNGTNITYTAANTFSDGDYVTITGITPSGFNISGTVTQSNANSFKVANTFQGTYTSGGTAYSRVEANPDLGFAGGYNDGTYHHAGLFRDASDSGKFKFFQGYIPEPTVDIDTTDVSFALAPIAVSSIEATSATIGSVTNTELQYVHGVTSAIQTQIDSKAPLASPTFTGTVTLPSNTVTNSMLAGSIAASKITGTAVTQADTGTVTNGMLAGSISASKITGTAVTQADTGTVTSAMILDGTIVNADINASAAIATSKISGLDTALASKAPLAAPTFTGLVTVSSSGIAYSDKTQTAAGVPSRTPIAATISTTPTRMASGLQDNMVPLSGAVTITIDDTTNAAYSIGESVDFFQISGTGAVFAKAGSVNLMYTPGLALRTTYSSATVQKITSTDWLVYGDLKA